MMLTITVALVKSVSSMESFKEIYSPRTLSALTHPLTILAVGILLLNDLVFKSLWSSWWITGKLSDFAWVVFAPPLLTFLLVTIASPLMSGNESKRNRRRAFVERIAFVSGYAMLPLLYVAFNTFEPVHDSIVKIISLATPGFSTSPIDPTDSLVIPMGLGIGLWIRSRTPATAHSLRNRFTLLIACVAILASIASIESPIPLGITHVDGKEDGSVIAESWQASINSLHDASYVSNDGGLTWDKDESLVPLSDSVRGDVIVSTPRGIYTIQRHFVIRVEGDKGVVVYSPDPYWEETHSRGWLVKGIGDLRGRRIDAGGKCYYHDCIRPSSLTYDHTSGNLIVAMGLEGVVVIDPEENWRRIGVEHYRPPRSVNILSYDMWLIGLALVMSFTAFAVIFAQDIKRPRRFWIPIMVFVPLALIILLTILYIPYWVNFISSGVTSIVNLILFGLVASIAILRILVSGHTHGTDVWLVSMSFGLSLIALILFSLSSGVERAFLVEVATLGLIYGVAPIYIYIRKILVTNVVFATLAMMSFYALVLVLWLGDNINLVTMYLAVVVLLGLTMWLLRARLIRILDEQHLATY